MTVKDLIEQLNTLDPGLHVFVNGYEGGYHYASISEPKTICLDVNGEEYYGPHEDPSWCPGDPSMYEQVKGIVL